VAGVVGIVAVVPCRSMGVMASVTLEVQPSCVGSLAPRRRLGRGGVCARAQEGSGEAGLASEAKGSSETELAPEAKGSSETELAPEAKGSGEMELALEPFDILSVCFIPFCIFYSLDLGIPFYGTQHTWSATTLGRR